MKIAKEFQLRVRFLESASSQMEADHAEPTGEEPSLIAACSTEAKVHRLQICLARRKVQQTGQPS